MISRYSVCEIYGQLFVAYMFRTLNNSSYVIFYVSFIKLPFHSWNGAQRGRGIMHHLCRNKISLEYLQCPVYYMKGLRGARRRPTRANLGQDGTSRQCPASLLSTGSITSPSAVPTTRYWSTTPKGARHTHIYISSLVCCLTTATATGKRRNSEQPPRPRPTLADPKEI